MKSYFCLIFLALGISSIAQKTYEYPLALKDSTFNTYFDEVIADPYQWMENADDPRLEEWLDDQQRIIKRESRQQKHFYDLRAQLVNMFRVRREKTDDYVASENKKKKKYDFKFEWNSYTGSRDLLYKLADDKNWKKLIRGKDFLENKDDKLQYQESVYSENENLGVFPISMNGSDWAKAYIFDLTTGTQFPYVIENIRTGANFNWRGRELYYTAYDEPVKGRELLDKPTGQALYKLEIKDLDARPELLYKNPDTTGTRDFGYSIKNDRLRLYHYINSRGTWYNSIAIADLNKDRFQPQGFMVYPAEDGMELYITHTKNDTVFLQTNIGAPNGKVLIGDINKPNELAEFIPEYDIDLQYVNKLGKDKLACVYLSEGQNIALIFNMKGELLRKIDFPKGKKLNYFYENSDEAERTSFSISSFFHPRTWYQLDLNTLDFKPSQSLSVPYRVEDLETRYVTYTSKDGTKIPMYITCKKGTVLDGNNPVLLYGYGGYGKIVEPTFDQATGLLLAHGGILAVPNVRGGGAKGSDWALAGRRLNKKKAIEDFIAAGEYLIQQKYTSSDKLVIKGGSHGALLAEAAATQRPELFKAVIAEAGPYDMLRFSLYTVGGVDTNINEFGQPDTEEDYKNLKSYSPLHQLKEGVRYPNTLLLTGDSDDRVPPHHSYKFLAKLQEVGDPAGLYQLYLTPGSGHGGALSREDIVEKLMFEYYFLFEQLEIEL